MKLVQEGPSTTVDTLATFSGTSGVATLDHKTFNYPVKDRSIVVSLETELNKVATSSRGFICPQVDLNVSIVCFQDDSS